MNIFKSFSIYILSSLINAGLPFLLLPILTSYLTKEEYGLLAIIQIFIVFTLPFISINISSTIQVNFHHIDVRDFAVLVSSILVIPIFTSIAVIIVFFLSEALVRSFIDIPLVWIFLIPLIALMQVIPQTVLYIYMMSERATQYGKFQVSLSAFNLLLSFLFVVTLTLNWEGRILAIFFTYTTFTLFGIYLLFKMKLLVMSIEKKYIIEALKLGLPLIIHVVSGALFMMSDRLFISYYLGNSQVGIYAVGAQVGMIALIIQQSFNQAWVPYLFKNLKTNLFMNNVKIVKISYMAFVFFLIIPFAVHFLSYLIFSLLIDKKFSDSIQYVFWVALGFSLLGMYKVVTNYIFYEKKTQLLAIVTFSSLIMNLVFNYIFIHKYGAIGVAYATALTALIFFILTFVLAQKVHPMPWLRWMRK